MREILEELSRVVELLEFRAADHSDESQFRLQDYSIGKKVNLILNDQVLGQIS